MRIALIAPPFIAVPPRKYGGTELFVAELARGLQAHEIDVTVYANGESTVDVPVRWIYRRGEWPVEGEVETTLKGLNHFAWAVADAAKEAEVIHVNSALGIGFARFIDTPMVHTVHHTYDTAMTEFYRAYPYVRFVTISDFQRTKLRLPRVQTIHHGIDASLYPMVAKKKEYLSFLGRIAPAKGTHLAIEIARRTGVPLKIAGEIQPVYKGYWETAVKPMVDGRFIEYVGEVGMEEKIELLGNSMAMLFPVQWDEPFGLVMIEAMACGTPVLALRFGSVMEVVREGVSGCVRENAADLALCLRDLKIPPATVRGYMEEFFSMERMTSNYISLYTEILRDRVAEPEQTVA